MYTASSTRNLLLLLKNNNKTLVKKLLNLNKNYRSDFKKRKYVSVLVF